MWRLILCAAGLVVISGCSNSASVYAERAKLRAQAKDEIVRMNGSHAFDEEARNYVIECLGSSEFSVRARAAPVVERGLALHLVSYDYARSTFAAALRAHPEDRIFWNAALAHAARLEHGSTR